MKWNNFLDTQLKIVTAGLQKELGLESPLDIRTDKDELKMYTYYILSWICGNLFEYLSTKTGPYLLLEKLNLIFSLYEEIEANYIVEIKDIECLCELILMPTLDDPEEDTYLYDPVTFIYTWLSTWLGLIGLLSRKYNNLLRWKAEDTEVEVIGETDLNYETWCSLVYPEDEDLVLNLPFRMYWRPGAEKFLPLHRPGCQHLSSSNDNGNGNCNCSCCTLCTCNNSGNTINLGTRPCDAVDTISDSSGCNCCSCCTCGCLEDNTLSSGNGYELVNPDVDQNP